MSTNEEQVRAMRNLDANLAKNAWSTWTSKMTRMNHGKSEIQVDSRIWESILVFGGEIPLETWQLGRMFGNFLLYTHCLSPSMSRM